MASNVLSIELRIAWWWWPYLYGLVTVAVLTGCVPCWTKVEAVARRATIWRIGRWRAIG